MKGRWPVALEDVRLRIVVRLTDAARNPGAVTNTRGRLPVVLQDVRGSLPVAL